MDWFARFVLRQHKWIIIIFAAAAVICAVLQAGVHVNYDMADYLPEDSSSTVGLNVLYDEFGEAVPNARVMIPNVTIMQALEYKSKIAAINGVSGVLWLDDLADLKQPVEALDQSLVEAYYKDGTALLSLTVKKGEEVRIVTKIREIIGESGAISGEAVVSETAQSLAGSEALKAMLFLIPIILLILFLSTTSWFAPVLFLCSIGAAVLLNMGTNLLFGQVSYITYSISPILQMAVSLDYSIFLLHSFETYREENNSVYDAMFHAIKRTFPSVMASALTTLFGFLVLALMQFKIGPDLGLNLAKGILFSLISSIVLLPAMTLASYRLLDKTKHRSLMPRFRRTSKLLLKARIPALIVVALLIVPSFLAKQNNSFVYGMGELDRTQRAGQDEVKIDAAFGQSTPIVVLVPKGEYASEVALSDELGHLPGISSVVSYANAVGVEIPGEYLNASVTSQFYSEHYSRLIVYAKTGIEGTAAFSVVKSVRETVASYYGEEAYLCGESATLYDMRDVVTHDNSLVGFLAVLAIGLVILFTFKSLSIPLLLLLTIESAIWINLALPYFQGITFCYIGFLVINTVQLGATVDYAILFSDHYMLNRKKMTPYEAARKTIQDTTGSILISGTTLACAGFMIGIVSSNDVVSQLGSLIGKGTICSMAMVLLFLPAALTYFDRFVALGTLRPQFLKQPHSRDKGVSRHET